MGKHLPSRSQTLGKPWNPKKKQRPVPPMRACRECGVGMRSWTRDPLCRGCIKLALEPQGESLRDFRARLKESEKPPDGGMLVVSLVDDT